MNTYTIGRHSSTAFKFVCILQKKSTKDLHKNVENFYLHIFIYIGIDIYLCIHVRTQCTHLYVYRHMYMCICIHLYECVCFLSIQDRIYQE